MEDYILNDQNSNYTKIMDKFYGMISKKTALKIMKGELSIQPDADNQNIIAKDTQKNQLNDTTDVRNIVEFINTQRNKIKVLNTTENAQNPESYIVNIEDEVYRVFNSTPTKNTKIIRRTIVLGHEGSSINLIVHNKLSDFIDVNDIERGDTILVRRAKLDIKQAMLFDQKNTIISKISPSKQKTYLISELDENMKGIDVIGRVTEISPIKYVAGLGNEQIAVANCIISMNKESVNVSLWGSSALATAKMNLNDYIKIEFCNVRKKFDKLEVIANDYSRVLVNNILAQRVKKVEQ
ncbi:MAG: hypothetical protein ACP5RI_01465 [Candidatus Micrarchaeia archaeon]